MLKKNEQGFTMVELLVAMGILLVLVAVAVPVYANQRTKANETAVKAEVEQAAVQWQRDYYASINVWDSLFLEELNVEGAQATLTGYVYEVGEDEYEACLEGVSKRDENVVYSFAMTAQKGAKTTCANNPHM